MKRLLPADYRLVGLATFTLLILAFFMVSCMREEVPEATSSKTSRIAQAKAWLAEKYPHTRFTLRWDAVTEQQVGKLVVMDVPLICAPGEYGMNVEVAKQELDERYYYHPVRLELAVDPEHGVAGAFIYTVVPTVAYMEKKNFTYEDVRYHSPHDLTGAIYRYGLYGEPQVMDYFEGGQLRWRRLPLSRTHSAEELDKLGKAFMKRMGSDNGSGEWGSCAWETGWCDICGDYHGDDLGEGGISVCRKCGDRYCWGDCWVDPGDWWPDDPAPSVCHTCGRLMDACACNPGEGKEEGPIPNPPPNTTPDPPANPKDPCGQAQIMTSDVGLNSRMVDLQSRINPNTEEGYMIDANGTIHPVPDSLKGKDYLYFEFDAFKKYTEANHSHHTGDVLGFDPGDLHVHYQFYKMNKMVDVNTFRFMITLEGQAICLQITNEAAYKAFTKKHNLWKGDSDLHEAITIFFKENGIDDIQEQDTAPTRTFEELTSTLVSFFAAQENGAGISVSVGKRNGGQIEWEAKEKDSAATTSSTPPKMKKRCN